MPWHRGISKNDTLARSGEHPITTSPHYPILWALNGRYSFDRFHQPVDRSIPPALKDQVGGRPASP
jgi:hypothetical protein